VLLLCDPSHKPADLQHLSDSHFLPSFAEEGLIEAGLDLDELYIAERLKITRRMVDRGRQKKRAMAALAGLKARQARLGLNLSKVKK
jgi:hypothetical protein